MDSESCRYSLENTILPFDSYQSKARVHMYHAANPFQAQPDGTSPNAFVAREATYTWIHQKLADSQTPHAVTLSGVEHVGKTTLLWHFNAVLKADLLGVYVHLPQVATERDIITLLAQQVSTSAALPQLANGASDADDPRTTFADDILPLALGQLGQRQRMILLLDDGHHLLGLGDASVFAYLSDLIVQHPRLGIVMTMDSRHESAALAAMRPLVAETHLHRLRPFTPPETRSLLGQGLDAFRVSADGLHAVQALTGGQPLLTQQFGALAYNRASQSDAAPDIISGTEVAVMLPDWLEQVDDIMTGMWHRLNNTQQIVLMAVCQVSHPNVITPEQIEAWLVETETSLDLTAIRAALRGLAYESLIRYEGGEVRLVMGIWRAWLAQHHTVPNALVNDAGGTTLALWQVAIGTLIVIAIGVTLIVWAARPDERPPATNPAGQPTVTFEPLSPNS